MLREKGSFYRYLACVKLEYYRCCFYKKKANNLQSLLFININMSKQNSQSYSDNNSKPTSQASTSRKKWGGGRKEQAREKKCLTQNWVEFLTQLNMFLLELFTIKNELINQIFFLMFYKHLRYYVNMFLVDWFNTQ